MHHCGGDGRGEKLPGEKCKVSMTTIRAAETQLQTPWRASASVHESLTLGCGKTACLSSTYLSVDAKRERGEVVDHPSVSGSVGFFYCEEIAPNMSL